MEVLDKLTSDQFIGVVLLIAAIALLPTGSALFLIAHFLKFGLSVTIVVTGFGLVIDLLTRYSRCKLQDVKSVIEFLRPPARPKEAKEKAVADEATEEKKKLPGNKDGGGEVAATAIPERD